MEQPGTRKSDRSASEARAAEMLAAVRLRRTPRRIRLLSLLLRARRPMSHLEIHRAPGTETADRVSVYRALEAFVEKGLVHRALVDGRTWMYESADRCGSDYCHPHFTCRLCGEVTCLVGVNVPVIRRIAGGYLPERQQVHISGICPRCRGRESGK